mmetsp:Transcript_45439/g.74171  ORF Transcript_45439/g.74171 Transcript_45439/m.74171 type:complete len:206 (+) Transcript_45439:630-1247(+)
MVNERSQSGGAASKKTKETSKWKYWAPEGLLWSRVEASQKVYKVQVDGSYRRRCRLEAVEVLWRSATALHAFEVLRRRQQPNARGLVVVVVVLRVAAALQAHHREEVLPHLPHQSPSAGVLALQPVQAGGALQHLARDDLPPHDGGKYQQHERGILCSDCLPCRHGHAAPAEHRHCIGVQISAVDKSLQLLDVLARLGVCNILFQ